MFSFASVIDTDAEHVFALVEQGKSCDIKNLKSSAEIRVLGNNTNVPTRNPTRIQTDAEILTLTVTGLVIISGNIGTLRVASSEDVEIVLESAKIKTVLLQNPTVSTLINFKNGKIQEIILNNRSMSFPKLELVGIVTQRVMVFLRGNVKNLVLLGSLFIIYTKFAHYPKNISIANSASYLYTMLK